MTVPSTSIASFLATGCPSFPLSRRVPARQAPTHERVGYQTHAATPASRSAPRQTRGEDLADRRSVIAMVCSKWAASEPSRVTTVQPSGRRLDLVAAEREHRLDRKADARARAACPSPADPVVRDLGLLVHRRPDAVADELADDAVAAPASRRPRRPPPMSPMPAPGHGRRDAGHHRQPGRVDELADTSGGDVPDDEGPGARRRASPRQIAPASIETTWPSRITRSPGMPWTTSSSIEMQIEPGTDAPVAVALERRDRPGAADVRARRCASRSAGRHAGLELGLDAARGPRPRSGPARRILSISAARLAGDHGSGAARRASADRGRAAPSVTALDRLAAVDRRRRTPRAR